MDVQATLRNPRRIPLELTKHPLVRSKYFLTLPASLLKIVIRTLGKGRFDAPLIELELALSALCGDHSSFVGIRNGALIGFNLLRMEQLELDELEQAQLREWGHGEFIESVGLANSRIESLHRASRGYLGWLLTNPMFIQEHDDLLHAHRDEVKQYGIPQSLGIRIGDETVLPGWSRASEDAEASVLEFQEFCARWELQSLAAPRLPNPLQAHLPLLGPALGTPQLAVGDTEYYYPPTVPIFGEGMFQDIVNESRRSLRESPHLDEWLDIIDSENTGKNVIGHFARVFEVQHYWRLLHQRHSASLKRSKSRLIVACAEYFGVSTDAIKRDLKLVSARLGSKWEEHPDPLD